LFGFNGYGLWLVVFAVVCTLLALGGPLVVVRQWLEKFGVWLVYGATLWMTIALFTQYDVLALLRQPGTGELPFWLAVDLAVAMPVSWLPLVADFTRFARKPRAALGGTYLGYLLANVWFYALGALFMLVLQLSAATPENLATAIVGLTGSVIALIVILVNEVDNAFADIYSASVTVQNVLPRVPQRSLIVGIGALSLLLAAFLTMGQYFGFLLAIGSVFSPLFGILAADYFCLRRRRIDVGQLYEQGGAYWFQEGVNWLAVVAWAAGVAVYHLVARGLPWLGATLPGFGAAFVLHLALAGVRRAVQRQ
jgi:putative hydroxymethylpyrimidine transporter CytX